MRTGDFKEGQEFKLFPSQCWKVEHCKCSDIFSHYLLLVFDEMEIKLIHSYTNTYCNTNMQVDNKDKDMISQKVRVHRE